MAKVNAEKFYNKIKERCGDTVTVMSEFVGSEKPIDIIYHCKEHGDTYTTLNAKNIFKSNFCTCKMCQSDHKKKSRAESKGLTKEDYYKRLVKFCADKDGTVLEDKWITSKTVYHFKCSNLNHPPFESTADSLISGNHWCPYCSGRKGDFDTEFEILIKNKNGTKLSKYKNGTTPILVQCNEDGYIWEVLPNNLQKGRWCPICNLPFTERVVWDYLQDNNIKTQIQYKFDDLEGENHEKLKFDFAIFNKSKLHILIEVDDAEHYFNHPKCERRQKAKMRDIAKDEYCRLHNIPLYRMRVPFRNDKDKMSYKEYYEYIHNQLYLIISGCINHEEVV